MFYVACPKLGEGEYITSEDQAFDVCYAMHESESVCDLDRAYLICLDLAEEFGYAEIRHNGHHIADYGDPSTFLG